MLYYDLKLKKKSYHEECLYNLVDTRVILI